jgi:hypothetical protein
MSVLEFEQNFGTPRQAKVQAKIFNGPKSGTNLPWDYGIITHRSSDTDKETEGVMMVVANQIQQHIRLFIELLISKNSSIFAMHAFEM